MALQHHTIFAGSCHGMTLQELRGFYAESKPFWGWPLCDHGTIFYFLKILSKNVFISFHEFLSASALYSIGILNFLPVSVEAGLVNACVAFAYIFNVLSAPIESSLCFKLSASF